MATQKIHYLCLKSQDNILGTMNSSQTICDSVLNLHKPAICKEIFLFLCCVSKAASRIILYLILTSLQSSTKDSLERFVSFRVVFHWSNIPEPILEMHNGIWHLSGSYNRSPSGSSFSPLYPGINLNYSRTINS